MPAHGEPIDELRAGEVTIVVRHSCIRRDLYELTAPGPLSLAVVERLRERGRVIADTVALVIVDVPAVHRLTIAPGLGRVVAMPKLATTRIEQREAAIALARQLSEPA